MNDIRLLIKNPGALVASVAAVTLAVSAIMLFPEQRVSAAANGDESGTEQQVATPSASAAQLKQLEDWLGQQPRLPGMMPTDGAVVAIMKFNDYQCPGCGQTYRDYKPVLAKYQREQPGKVKFTAKDFPLERECNVTVQQDLHLGACEAAVAVRLARENGKAEAMEDWLYSNQPAMNPETVKKAAASVGGVTNFDARYAATLALVRTDVTQGTQLQVGSTPTFFLNGIRLPPLKAEFFDLAIAWELKRVAAKK